MLKKLEDLSGTVKLYRHQGEFLSEVAYRIAHHQELLDASADGNPDQLVEGLHQIHGSISADPGLLWDLGLYPEFLVV